MLSRDAIVGRLHEDEHQFSLMSKRDQLDYAGARNPGRWNTWFDVTADLLGADWRDLDADWWREQFDRELTPAQAIRRFLEETA